MSKRRALLIEDDTILSILFSEVLARQTDLDIEVFHDGQAAMDRLNGAAVDLVIMDLHLPNVSGQEILDQLRRSPAWDQTRVLVMSADILAVEAIRGKPDLTLVKPVDLADFCQAVDQLIDEDG